MVCNICAGVWPWSTISRFGTPQPDSTKNGPRGPHTPISARATHNDTPPNRHSEAVNDFGILWYLLLTPSRAPPSMGAINNNVPTDISLANGQAGIDILLEAPPLMTLLPAIMPLAVADDRLHLFWVKGPTGAGNSAIIQIYIEKLKELGKLGAMFFFSVNGMDNAAQFTPNIVYQLSVEFSDSRDLALLVEPLQELENAGEGIGRRVAILVDGFDECNSTGAQPRIIEIVGTAACDGVTPCF
ncbi:hypothetical protein P691DRAFT_757255 [Macrolepiota fuliginosa MF-IS2]|uniref:Nephrocystin 3-like N-terminal domain-containing protein n=1 Tax=Macrolepiota fuliginosa MF-IS2 TaxID=1400762 RepID=A0A9P5XKJ4_9AGAR|nr:hypothetical protein P691DRAFT_757255 [Macrolepiota fuliginosa MF-IS2]